MTTFFLTYRKESIGLLNSSARRHRILKPFPENGMVQKRGLTSEPTLSTTTQKTGSGEVPARCLSPFLNHAQKTLSRTESGTRRQASPVDPSPGRAKTPRPSRPSIPGQPQVRLPPDGQGLCRPRRGLCRPHGIRRAGGPFRVVDIGARVFDSQRRGVAVNDQMTFRAIPAAIRGVRTGLGPQTAHGPSHGRSPRLTNRSPPRVRVCPGRGAQPCPIHRRLAHRAADAHRSCHTRIPTPRAGPPTESRFGVRRGFRSMRHDGAPGVAPLGLGSRRW